MSMRLEMLQVARLAPKLLGESTQLIADFLRRQQNSDGGFRDRAGRSDLYYTVFGIDGLIALQADLPILRVEEFLRSFGDGPDLVGFEDKAANGRRCDGPLQAGSVGDDQIVAEDD